MPDAFDEAWGQEPKPAAGDAFDAAWGAEPEVKAPAIPPDIAAPRRGPEPQFAPVYFGDQQMLALDTAQEHPLPDPNQNLHSDAQRVQSIFTGVIEPEVAKSPERFAKVWSIAKRSGLNFNTVDARAEEFIDADNKAKQDPVEWVRTHPGLADYVLRNPQIGVLVPYDPGLDRISRNLNDIYTYGKAELVKGALGLGLMTKVDDEGKPLPTEWSELNDKLATDIDQEQAANPLIKKPQAGVARLTEDAKKVNESPFGGALAAARRTDEAVAGLNADMLWFDIAMRRHPFVGPPKGTSVQERLALDYEQASEPRAYQQGELSQFFGKAGGGVSSSMMVGADTVKGATAAGAALGVPAAGVTFAATRNPELAAEMFWEAAGVGAKLGGEAGAYVGTLRSEAGGAYKELLRTTTDDGQPLPESVAFAGAMIYGNLASAIEVGTMGPMLSVFGPAGEFIRTGSRKEAVAALLKNPLFLNSAKRLAKQWAEATLAESGEEGFQAATKDATKYLVTSVFAGAAQKGQYGLGGGVDVGGAVNEAVEAIPSSAILAGTGAVSQSVQARALGALPGVGATWEAARSSTARYQAAKIAAGFDIHEQVMLSDLAHESASIIHELANFDESPTKHADPEGVAEALQRGGLGPNVHTDAKQLVKFYQSKRLDVAKAAIKDIGPDGAKALDEALKTGQPVAVPTSSFIQWDDEQKKALEPHTTTRSDLAAMAQANKKMFDERVEALVKQLQSGPMAAESEGEANFLSVAEHELSMSENPKLAREKMEALRAFVRVKAETEGKSADELFKNFAILVGRADPTMEEVLNNRLEQGRVNRAEELLRDENTGMPNENAMALAKPGEGETYGHLAVEGYKWLNDNAGHEKADLLGRAVALALHEHGGRSFKLPGADFGVFTKSKADLDALAEKVREALPPQLRGFAITTAVGKTLAEASATNQAAIDEQVKKGERANPRPPHATLEGESANAERPKGVTAEAKDIAIPETKASAAIAPEAVESVNKLTPEDYFKTAYRDQVTGAWTRRAWNAMRRKAHVVMIDAAGLGNLNKLGGKAVGNILLHAIGRFAAELSGHEFDFTHLSGDEFAAQHDDPAVLEAFMDLLQAKLGQEAIEYRVVTDVPELNARVGELREHVVSLHTGYGERSLEKADHDLNERKSKRKRARELGINRGADQRVRNPRGDAGARAGAGAGGAEGATGTASVVRGDRPAGRVDTGGSEAGGDQGVHARSEGGAREEPARNAAAQGEADALAPVDDRSEEELKLDYLREKFARARNSTIKSSWKKLLDWQESGGKGEFPSDLPGNLEKAAAAAVGVANPKGVWWDEQGRDMRRPMKGDKRKGGDLANRKARQYGIGLSGNAADFKEGQYTGGPMIFQADEKTLLYQFHTPEDATRFYQGDKSPQAFGSALETAGFKPGALGRWTLGNWTIEQGPDLSKVDGRQIIVREQTRREPTAEEKRLTSEYEAVLERENVARYKTKDAETVKQLEAEREGLAREMKAYRKENWLEAKTARFPETTEGLQRAIVFAKSGGAEKLYQGESTVGPVWHSAVENAVAAAKQEKNTPAAWLSVIEKTPGVKKEEVDFMGLGEWLKSQKGSITRSQVQEFVNAHKLEVTEKGLDDEEGPRSTVAAQRVEQTYKPDDWTGLNWEAQATARTGDDDDVELTYSSQEDIDRFREKADAVNSRMVELHQEAKDLEGQSDETEDVTESEELHRRAKMLTEKADQLSARLDAMNEVVSEAERELEKVKFDAAASREDGAAALAAFRRGDIDEAIDHARDASSREQQYGDDPTWGPFRVALLNFKADSRGTQYQSYVLGGHAANSYREVLFYAPGTSTKQYKAPHFHESGQGLLAHARISEHVDKDGKPMLFVEEIQSDLHQAARDKGYERRKKASPLQSASEAVRVAHVRIRDALYSAGVAHDTAQAIIDDYESGRNNDVKLSGISGRQGRLSSEDLERIEKAGKELRAARVEFSAKVAEAGAERRDANSQEERVPDAPFKTTWDEMVAKRLIRYAAEHGFDKIGWTTGEQQAERYNLAKQVDSITYHAESKKLTAEKGGGQVLNETVDPKDLPNYVGEAMAKKLLEAPAKAVTQDDVAAARARQDAAREAFKDAYLEKYPGKNTAAIHRADELEGGALPTVYSGGGDERLFDTAVKLGDASQEHDRLDEAAKHGPASTLSGVDLKIGGEGMKSAYDRRIPGIFEKLVKKFGGKVSKETLKKNSPPPSPMYTVVRDHDGWAVRNTTTGDLTQRGHASETAAQYAADSLNANETRTRKDNGGEVWTVTVPEALRKQVLEKGQPLFAGPKKGEESQGPRGYTGMSWEQAVDGGLTRLYNVVLNPNADLSTFMHESAHVFLDMMAHLAMRPDASDRLRLDWALTLKYLKATSAKDFDLAQSGEAAREKHEKFAEAFERYLYEGKAPSSKLEGAFARYRLWIAKVYGNANVPGAHINDEIRQVFDRMLATDAEIDEQKRRMGDIRPAAANLLGLDPEHFREHIEAATEATSVTRKRIDMAVYKDLLREKESWWKEQLKAEKEKAKQDYEALPARQLQNALANRGDIKTGPLDEAKVKEAIGPLARRLGKEAVKKDGADPAPIAEFFGFPTTEAMLKELLALPARNAWVKETADKRMAEKHPELLAETHQLQERIDKGLHGDADTKFLEDEVRLMAKRMSMPGTPLTGVQIAPVDQAKKAAERIVAERSVQRLDSSQALAAERKSATEAMLAADKGNHTQAFVKYVERLTNHYVWKYLLEAREMRDATLKLAHDLERDVTGTKSTLGKASPVYRDEIANALGELGLSAEGDAFSPDALIRQMEKDNAEGRTVIIGFDPDVIRAIFDKVNRYGNGKPRGLQYTVLTVAELRAVRDMMANVKDAARGITTVLVNEKRLDRDEVVQLVIDAFKQNLSALPPPGTKGAASMWRAAGGLWNWADGSQLKPETVLQWLSNGDTASIVWRALGQPLQDAKHKEQDLMDGPVKMLVHAQEKMGLRQKVRGGERIDGHKLFPEHTEQFAPPQRRWEFIQMLLHMGNASNKKKMLEGRNIRESEVWDAFLKLGITKEEMDYVQANWDAAESLKKEAFDLDERDTGIRPEEVEAEPVNTPYGQYRGGYFPVAYETRTNVGQRQEASLQPAGFAAAATNHNYLKSRAEDFVQIVSFDPNKIYKHIAQVAHDVAFRERLRSVALLFRNQRLRDVLIERVGQERADIFEEWLRDIGAMRGLEGGTPFLMAMQTLRGTLSVGVLGYSLPNVLEDAVTGIVGAGFSGVINPAHVAAAMSDLEGSTLGDMSGLEKAEAESGELRSRHKQLNRELLSNVKRWTSRMTGKMALAKAPLDFIRENAFVMQEIVDRRVSAAIYLAAKRQALAGIATPTEEQVRDAILDAEAKVRLLLPTSHVVDSAAVMRDRGVIGGLMVFQRFWSQAYNLTRAQQGRDVWSKQSANAMGTVMGFIFAYAILGSLARGQGKQPDETWPAWFIRQIATGTAGQFVGGGDVSSAVWSAAYGGKKREPRNNSLAGMLQGIITLLAKASNGDKETGERAGAALRASGLMTGLPPLQAMKTMGYLYDLSQGNVHARGPFDVIGGTGYGQSSHQDANLPTMIQDVLSGEPVGTGPR